MDNSLPSMSAGSGAGSVSGEQPAVQTAAQKVQQSLQKASKDDMDSFEADSSQRRQRLRTLFQAMDRDGNGKLDVAEFRGELELTSRLLRLVCTPCQES